MNKSKLTAVAPVAAYVPGTDTFKPELSLLKAVCAYGT